VPAQPANGRPPQCTPPNCPPSRPPGPPSVAPVVRTR
jgi:hypothetical protein